MVDFYQTRISTRINLATERLALLSAVFLPITAISGIFGMNVVVNANSQWGAFAAILSVMGVSICIMLYFARKRGWWQ